MQLQRNYLLLLFPLLLAIPALASLGFFYQAAVPGSATLIILYLYRNRLKSTSDIWFLVLAFVFSIAGDWFLSNKGDSFFRFSFGIGLYLVAHLGYLWFALRNGKLPWGFTGIVLAGFLVFFFVSLVPAISDTVLLVAVLAYLLISCFSLGAAWGIKASGRVKWGYFAAIFLIVLSDTVIALKEFLGMVELDPLIQPTYYGAHILITFALISRLQKDRQTLG